MSQNNTFFDIEIPIQDNNSNYYVMMLCCVLIMLFNIDNFTLIVFVSSLFFFLFPKQGQKRTLKFTSDQIIFSSTSNGKSIQATDINYYVCIQNTINPIFFEFKSGHPYFNFTIQSEANADTIRSWFEGHHIPLSNPQIKEKAAIITSQYGLDASFEDYHATSKTLAIKGFDDIPWEHIQSISCEQVLNGYPTLHIHSSKEETIITTPTISQTTTHLVASIIMHAKEAGLDDSLMLILEIKPDIASSKEIIGDPHQTKKNGLPIKRPRE